MSRLASCKKKKVRSRSSGASSSQSCQSCVPSGAFLGAGMGRSMAKPCRSSTRPSSTSSNSCSQRSSDPGAPRAKTCFDCALPPKVRMRSAFAGLKALTLHSSFAPFLKLGRLLAEDRPLPRRRAAWQLSFSCLCWQDKPLELFLCLCNARIEADFVGRQDAAVRQGPNKVDDNAAHDPFSSEVRHRILLPQLGIVREPRPAKFEIEADRRRVVDAQ